MFKKVVMAIDGSLGAEWVNKYALNLAGQTEQKEITWVCVREQSGATQGVETKMESLLAEAQARGLKASRHILEGSDKSAAIAEFMPKGPDTLLVTGTRHRESRLGFLQGSVSAGLLRDGSFPVLAIRVAQPGLLGHPHEWVWSLSGNPLTIEKGLPLLRLFHKDIKNIHLLRILGVPRHHYRHLTQEMVEGLEAKGEIELKNDSEKILIHFPNLKTVMDRKVVVSNDWAKEILIFSNRMKSNLLLMGASERSIPQKILYGNPLEEVLRKANCDVAVFRGCLP